MIRANAPCFYFANHIHEKHGVELVIVERAKVERPGLFDRSLKRFFRAREVNQKFFKDQWRVLDKSLRVAVTDDVNSEAVIRHLAGLKPGLILTNGVSILKDDVLGTSKLSLNLHLGLAPYYRGVHCVDWAMLNRDPYCAGVTMHRITKTIDGGDVAAQSRAVIVPDDDLLSIKAKLYLAGADICNRIIDKVKVAEKLKWHKQDLSLGRLYQRSDWNAKLDRELRRIEKSGELERMLREPSRKDVPDIIEL
jgi:methionyl-tRNA formyltransferase